VNGSIEYDVLVVIVNWGSGSDVVAKARKLGVSGGTIMTGRGTARSQLLKLLGIDDIKREVVLMAMPRLLEDDVFMKLREHLKLDQRGAGIAFSMPIARLLGMHVGNERPALESEEPVATYEAIFTVMERGRSEEVMEAVAAAGAEGGTVINARGCGVHETESFFAIRIEPEKEVLLLVVESSKVNAVVTAIEMTMHVDKPGQGILFSVPVNRTSGLYRNDA